MKKTILQNITYNQVVWFSAPAKIKNSDMNNGKKSNAQTAGTSAEGQNQDSVTSAILFSRRTIF